MQAGTPFAPDLFKYKHVVPNTAEQRRSSFESPGSGSAISSVPIACLAPQTGSLSLGDEHTSTPVVFLPVQFSDLAVSALIDSGAMHKFLVASLLLKLSDSPSFVLIVPCQLKVTLADRGVVQAAQLAKLALEVVYDQGVIVPGMPALEFYILNMLLA